MLRAFRILICSLWLGFAATGAVAQSDAVLRAQERLEELELAPGPVDGVMGSRTRTAIREFQRRNSLPDTGELDAATQSALLAGGLRRAPPPRPVSAPPAVPVPEVTATPLAPPGVPEPQPALATPSATAVPVPTASAPATSVQPPTRASPATTPVGNGTYAALAAAGLLGIWWLRRRSRAVAQTAVSSRTGAAPRTPPTMTKASGGWDSPTNAAVDTPSVVLPRPGVEEPRPSRTDELRAREQAAAERELSPIPKDSGPAQIWHEQSKADARPTLPRTTEAPRSRMS